MAENSRLICASSDLEEAGPGVRFEVHRGGQTLPAFVVRWRGEAHAYLNRCGHVPVELDWQPGDFFDLSRLYLVCATHGALYDPATGACLGGRCQGRGLVLVPVQERGGGIYIEES
jgi:nitrite reductase/ring-hydroxylating ferredoxin subunit